MPYEPALWKRDENPNDSVEEGIRKVDVWTARYRLATVAFPDETSGIDPFFNANTMDDIAEADRLAALDGG